MGSGKSSAAITYINEHPKDKFIYITPYLDEAERISKACKGQEFVEPKRMTEYSGSKTLHTLDLVRAGRNIATTHQAFKFYTNELLEEIRKQGYILIVDENVDVLESLEEASDDVQLAIDAGRIIEKSEGEFELTGNEDDLDYKGTWCKELFRLMNTRNVIKVTGHNKEFLYYWQLPASLIMSFKQVIVLTYMFEGQSFYHFLRMHDIPYEYIGIEHEDGGEYRFSPTGTYIPRYVQTLKNKIHVVDHWKMNYTGSHKFALSMAWFTRGGENVDQLRKHLINLFRNICPVDTDQRMWTTYKCAKKKLQGKGYTKGFVPFNSKATNEYRHKTVLAYCVNLYMNVGQKIFYQKHNIEVDEDQYALSNMVQWVWRSAIRDGKEIWLYIPSKRMRTLFINWMEDLSVNVQADL